MKKNIAILGSTGSIGTQTLEVAQNLGINITALSANKNIGLLEKQTRKFLPEIVAIYDEKSAEQFKQNVRDLNVKVVSGLDGLCEMASFPKSETLVTAISGMIGLKPTIEAVKSKKDIALANKETLVTGGELVVKEAKKNNVKILPVDSEHSAVFQCLEGCSDYKNLNKLILTASGGPFFNKCKKDLENVTLKDALNHPNWSMGKKITIDSATMMNKGLEIIEAVHLFNVPENKIDVVIHRESIVHSMIEYVDGSVMAQLGIPSMKTPIQYALTYPKRDFSQIPKLNLAKIQNLSFFEPDNITFEAMDICRKAINTGGTMPAIINAANEEAVKLFLDGKIKFLDITKLIKHAANHFNSENVIDLNSILKSDKITRDYINSLV